jgi:hypothetical protein
LRAGLEFSLDDAKVRRELRVVAFHAGDEPVGVFAADERLDGVAVRMVETRAEVDHGEDEQRRNATSAQPPRGWASVAIDCGLISAGTGRAIAALPPLHRDAQGQPIEALP